MPIKFSPNLIPKKDLQVKLIDRYGEEVEIFFPYFPSKKLSRWEMIWFLLVSPDRVCQKCGRARIFWDGKWVCPPLLTGECSASIDYSLAIAEMRRYEEIRPKVDIPQILLVEMRHLRLEVETLKTLVANWILKVEEKVEDEDALG